MKGINLNTSVKIEISGVVPKRGLTTEYICMDNTSVASLYSTNEAFNAIAQVGKTIIIHKLWVKDGRLMVTKYSKSFRIKSAIDIPPIIKEESSNISQLRCKPEMEMTLEGAVQHDTTATITARVLMVSIINVHIVIYYSSNDKNEFIFWPYY